MIPNTPQICNCGNSFSIDHPLICKKGGFPTLRHNEIRDLTASLLSEVCPIVATEPPLQLLSLESFTRQAANVDSEARLDIKARGFWSGAQDSFLTYVFFIPMLLAICLRTLLLYIRPMKLQRKGNIISESWKLKAVFSPS